MPSTEMSLPPMLPAERTPAGLRTTTHPFPLSWNQSRNREDAKNAQAKTALYINRCAKHRCWVTYDKRKRKASNGRKSSNRQLGQEQKKRSCPFHGRTGKDPASASPLRSRGCLEELCSAPGRWRAMRFRACPDHEASSGAACQGTWSTGRPGWDNTLCV